MKLRSALASLAASTVIALAAAPAQAVITIDPEDYVVYTENTSSANCNATCLELKLGLPAGTLTELYKDNEDGGEEGSFAGSYETTYGYVDGDPETATISYIGGPIITCTTNCYLLVKDGRNQPYIIVFNLGTGGYGWNGTERIFISEPLIWPEQGSISHVSIFSGGGTTVSEPGVLALLGLGLVGIGLARRRKVR